MSYKEEVTQRKREFRGEKSGNRIELEAALIKLDLITISADQDNGYEWRLEAQDASGARTAMPIYKGDLDRLKELTDNAENQ